MNPLTQAAETERPKRGELIDAAVRSVARRFDPHPRDYAERLNVWRRGIVSAHSVRAIRAEYRRLANAPEPTP